MRQDPDIIMVGEIRDLETAEMAIQAALTGHLVLSTLHTNDAPTAITRLLDLGVPPYLLNATHARRHGAAPGAHAVPALQADGRASTAPRTTPPGTRWSRRGSPSTRRKLYKPVGCLECRMTGYMGRIGIYEMLMFSLRDQEPGDREAPTSPRCASRPSRKA